MYLIQLVNQGTLGFMSVEVVSQCYLFQSPPYSVLDPEEYANEASTAQSKSFRYNYLHDIESMWWIGVRSIACNGIIEDKQSERAVENAEEQKPLARQYLN